MVDVPEVSTTSPLDLVAAGRRHLAVRDYNAAAEALAKACEQLAQEYGDTADECGEAFLWYGKALLGLSRQESGVLGNGIAGSNNVDDDEEDNEDEVDEENADEKGKTEDQETDNVEQNGDDKEKRTTVVEKIEAESTTHEEESGPSADGDDKPGTSNGEGHDESEVNLDDEDDVENLQLAWETLEMARSILEKRAERNATSAARALLADVYLALGEVALESETYDKAVSDMLKCLEIQKDNGVDVRCIAETHYQIGLANSLASNFDDAITHFKNAANLVESRIKTLESPSAAEDSTVKKYSADPFFSIEGEIKELKGLLPEIQEKIQDMMDYKAETKRRVREAIYPTNGEGFSNGAGSGNGAGSSKADSKPAASDISHLIKRKRNNSDGETESPAKRVSQLVNISS